MRSLVCCGKARAAAELFSTAETVPGVKPTRSATVLSVTMESLRVFVVFARGFIQQFPRCCKRAGADRCRATAGASPGAQKNRWTPDPKARVVYRRRARNARPAHDCHFPL